MCNHKLWWTGENIKGYCIETCRGCGKTRRMWGDDRHMEGRRMTIAGAMRKGRAEKNEVFNSYV